MRGKRTAFTVLACLFLGMWGGVRQPKGAWMQDAFPCPGCGKCYRYKRGLNFHLRNECGKDPHVQCPFCPHRSKQKGNVVAHIRLKHPDQDVDRVKNSLHSIYC